jgi:competence protein ComEA
LVVVDAAGCFTEYADYTYVNLAAEVVDCIKLKIPTITDAFGENTSEVIESFDLEVDSSNNSQSLGARLVNINTASKDELKTLPGIGDGIADRIIKYRTDNGKFSSIEDIMKISGIKDKLYGKIKDLITV